MMMVHRDNNHHRPFLTHANANANAIGFGDVDAGGPTGSSNTRPKTTNTYDVFASSDSGSGAATGGGAVGVRTLQPFTISPTINSIAHTAPKSPVEMAASLEYPFTSTQWKELERQAMIYKYMKASIPVPPDLLAPLARTPSLAPVASHSPLGSGALNLRFSNRGDLEPGRCRRTDGKKWRCSRDVALGQKYCERHMHRGRPRSRKPVELPNKKNRHTQAALPSSSSTILNKNASPSQLVGTLAQPFHQNQPTCFLDKTSEKDSPFWQVATVSSRNEPRSSDWIFNEELFPLGSCDPELQHLMQLGINTGSSFSNADESSVLNQNYNKEPLSLNLYSNYRATEDQQTNCYPLFLNSEIVPLEKSPEVAARGLIGAWSNHHSADSGTESSVSSKAKFSLSSLSLSMGVDHTRDDSMGPIHMGLGASECDQNHEYAPKSHPSSWLSPASWATSTPGGPLAEVLKPSKITATVAAAPKDGSYPSSPVNSPPLTAVSSTSNVLQRTFASLSDSSASSSPTLTSSGAKPEIGLMWLKGNY